MELKKNISKTKLQKFLGLILSKKSRSSKLITQLEDIIKFKDVSFYTWKILAKLLSSNQKENNEIYMLNVLELMEKISTHKNLTDKNKTEDDEEIFGLHQGTQEFSLDVISLKKYIRKVWESLVNRDISLVVHKKLLLVLLDHYLSDLLNPIFLTDFLMASMNIKGVIGILALQGVAILMQKHNIEYPNVYGKLYTMFEPDIFHMKFRSRLFYLANIFLSSTYLPEILVASFAKRASRLSLMCSAPDILIILRFVGNLLLRHTGLKKMIHYPENCQVQEDPFLMGENDPMKTHATESSLWEISLLNKHCQPNVSAAAKFIYFELPSLEFDLSEVLDNSYEDMFKSYCKKKKQNISLTFERPQHTIGKLKDDQVFKLWSLTK